MSFGSSEKNLVRFAAKSDKLYKRLVALRDSGGFDILKLGMRRIAEDYIKFYEERGFLTAAQWKFCGKIFRSHDDTVEDVRKDRTLINSLKEKFKAGELPETALQFVESICAQFEERMTLTPNQREQAEHINRRYGLNGEEHNV